MMENDDDSEMDEEMIAHKLRSKLQNEDKSRRPTNDIEIK